MAAFGTGVLKDYLGGSKKKRRKSSPPKTPLVFAPTPKGKAAEKAYHQAHLNLDLGPVPTKSTGPSIPSSLVDTLKSISTIDIPGTGGAKSLAEDEAKNLVEVAREHAENPGQYNVIPNEKQTRAASLVLAPVAPEIRSGSVLEKGAAAIVKASEKAADDTTVAGRFAKALSQASKTKGPVARVAEKVEPASVKAARTAAAKRAGAVAEKLPTPVRVVGKVAGRTATAPVKHPFTAPFALQAPLAIAHKDPGELAKALEGKGVEASIANAASHIAPIAGEAVNLPATVLPSTFLVGKAAASAAQGNSKELDALWAEYKKTGILPAIASGDLAAAKERFGEHPLFSALEASGAVNAAGRAAGAGLRAVPGADLASLAREPETVRGTDLQRQRGYSRDALRQVGQRAGEKAFPKQFGENVEPGTLRARRIEKEAQNRFEAGSERIRKRQLADNMQVLNNLLPRRGPKVRAKGHVVGKIDRRTAEVVNLAVERLIQHPDTFHSDLEHYKAMIDAAREEKHGRAFVLNRPQRRANKAISDQIAGALKVDDPGRIEATVQAANQFIEHQKANLDEMVQHGFLTHDQAEKATMIPFARVHLGSRYSIPKDRAPEITTKREAIAHLEAVRAQAIKDGASSESIDAITAEVHKAKRSHENAVDKHSQQVDAEGNALTNERIAEEMRKRGIKPGGFLSHRDPSNGDFYKPTMGGGKLDSGTRTGASAASGAHVGGVESLVRQVARSTNLLHRARTWNRAIDEFGVEVKGIDTAKEAKAVIAAPEMYGMPHDTELVAVPRYPFGAKKAEREGAIAQQDPRVLEALEHTDPTQASDAADKILHEELQAGFEGKLDPDAQVVLFPAKVGEQFLKSATPAPSYIRAVQAYTNLFKRAVLPFSPGFYIGNVFDNYMRTALAGINPFHMIVAHQVLKHTTEDQRAELIPKAHFASVEGLAPHRSVESLVKGADPISKGIRRSAEWSRTHGWEQAAVKFAPEILKQTTHYLLAVNAFVSEDLPQRGAIGKFALAEMAKTQGSWTKAITHFNEAAQDFTKGIEDRSKMVDAQKYLEEIYGNYTNMSPDARKLLGSITPFWTWMRAAYKFVYLTMPAHHSIATGVLTGMARATQDEREQYGLDKEGKEPLPNHLQGALPWPKGGIVPFGSYNSFGYASDPLDAVGKVVAPQLLGAPEALQGIDWKGDPIEKESDRLRAAAFAFAGSLLPGWNLLVHEKEGAIQVGPSVNLPHVEDSGYVQYAREPKQTITVPKSEGGSGSSDSFTDGYTKALGGGSSASFSEGFMKALGE